MRTSFTYCNFCGAEVSKSEFMSLHNKEGRYLLTIGLHKQQPNIGVTLPHTDISNADICDPCTIQILQQRIVNENAAKSKTKDRKETT